MGDSMGHAYKACSKCKYNHYTLDDLTYIDDTELGAHYSCICNTELIIDIELLHELETQSIEFAEQNKREDAQFYKEHYRWGRI